MNRRTLSVMNARCAIVELVFEVEATLKLLEQLPEEAPTSEQVENLRGVLAFRQQKVDEAMQALQGSLAGAVGGELLIAEQRATA